MSTTCLDRYRQHEGSTCVRAISSGDYHPDDPNPARGAFLRWVGYHLAQQRVTDASLWRALEHELFAYRHPFLHRTGRSARRAAAATVKGVGRRTLPPPLRRELRRLRAGWSARRP